MGAELLHSLYLPCVAFRDQFVCVLAFCTIFRFFLLARCVQDLSLFFQLFQLASARVSASGSMLMGIG